MSEKLLLPHTVTMDNRRQMSVTGVRQVVSYDEFRVVLRTDYGLLTIQGKNLVAGEISSSASTISLSGSFETLQYRASKDKSENLLSKLLK